MTCPERGDAVWLDFGSHGQDRRAALVLSPSPYNRRVRLALVCPITAEVTGYPFEVVIPEGEGVSGVILSDQVRSLDWQKRGAEFICKLPSATLDEVLRKARTLLT